ncbi:hypothetical protein J4467_02340 [Candidatus Woesearchaeota archaeon]|nr:hypothetical protein [Candidatus Woesearchaeota archaeon]
MKIIILAGWILGLLFIAGCSNEITCNAPYILVGESCCLDSNSNSICDSDEIITETTKSEENIIPWNSENMMVDGGTTDEFTICSGGFMVYSNIENLENKNSNNIQLSLFKQYYGEPEGYGIEKDNYGGVVLFVYTLNDLDYFEGIEYEGVTCKEEEYYDDELNEINTFHFRYDYVLPKDKYGLYLELEYEKDKMPKEAKYIITCKGNESGKEAIKTFRFNIDYVDSITIHRC